MMSWSYTPYLIPLLAAAVVSLGLIYPVWQRRRTNSALPLAAFAMLAALWCLGYALEIGWQTIEGKLFWVKIQYIAIVYVSPTFLLFCLRYTSLWRWPQRWQLAFFVLPSLILVSVWLEPGLGWFYRQVGLDSSGSFLSLALEYGPLFWLHTVYSYLLLLAGALLLLQMGWRLARPYRRQTYALVAATMLPWVGNAVYLSNINPLPYLDWTPIGFVGTAVFLSWTLRRLQLLDVAPVARELVFDSITDAVLVWSRQDRLLDFNATASALFHIAFPDDVGLAKAELFNGRFQPLRAVDITDSSGQVVKIHNAYGALYYQVIVSPVLDHQGKENGRLYILHDKTTSEKASRELFYQKQLFENLVEIAHAVSQTPHLPDTMARVLNVAVKLTNAETGSLLLLDNKENVDHYILARQDLETDSTACQEGIIYTTITEGLTGWVLRHKEPALLHDALHDERWVQLPEQPYIARSVLAIPILKQQQTLGILTLTHPEVARFNGYTLQLMQGAVNQIALAINNAQLYLAEQELVADISKARDKAEAANRAKSAFLTTMSHELRTPLSAIIGYNELAQELLDMGAAPAKIAGYLQKVDMSAQHLLALITDILDISTIEAGNLVLDIEQIDLNELMQQVIQTVDVLVAKNNNRFIVNCPPDLGTITTDPKRLRQILLNLLSNAAKFTEQGSVTLTVQQVGDLIQFKIADTGIGLTPAQMAQLFRPFMQADTTITRKYGGAGMGLSISQQISRLLGGKISVESEYGRGSTFTLNLPVTTGVIQP